MSQSQDQVAYLHDVNIGAPMSSEQIKGVLADQGESPGIRAVLHLLRNSMADSDREARSQPEHRDLRCGQAVAYEDAFWFVWNALGAGGGTVPDPDEREHAGE